LTALPVASSFGRPVGHLDDAARLGLLYELGNAFAARLELHELPAVLNPFSRLAEAKHPAARVVARPSVVAGQRYEEVTKAYIREVRSVLTGDQPPSAAAEALEQELIAITGFRPGPPAMRDW